MEPCGAEFPRRTAPKPLRAIAELTNREHTSSRAFQLLSPSRVLIGPTERVRSEQQTTHDGLCIVSGAEQGCGGLASTCDEGRGG